MGNVAHSQPGISNLPPWHRNQPGPWDFLHAPGWTGETIRKLPESTWPRLKDGLQASPHANPWSIVCGLGGWDPETVRFFQAGESQWQAYIGLGRIASGGATESSDSVEAYINGGRSPWVVGRWNDHWFGRTLGRENLQKITVPGFQGRLKLEIAEWESKKRHQCASEAEPKPIDYAIIPKVRHEIVRYWMSGPAGAPGFAWCSNQAGAAILQGAPAKACHQGINARRFKRECREAKLRKVAALAYFAESSGQFLVIRRRNRDEICRLQFPTV